MLFWLKSRTNIARISRVKINFLQFIYFCLDFTHIYITVLIPAVIQGWARPRWVVTLLLLGCTGGGGGVTRWESNPGLDINSHRERIEPWTGISTVQHANHWTTPHPRPAFGLICIIIDKSNDASRNFSTICMSLHFPTVCLNKSRNSFPFSKDRIIVAYQKIHKRDISVLNHGSPSISGSIQSVKMYSWAQCIVQKKYCVVDVEMYPV